MSATLTNATFLATALTLLTSCATTQLAADQLIVDLAARDEDHRQAIAALEAHAQLTRKVVDDLAHTLARRAACTGAPASKLVRAAPTLATTSAPNATVALIVLGNVVRPSKHIETMLTELRRTYGEALQVTYIHDREGTIAPRAAVAAGMQGRFWELRDRLIAGTPVPWGTSNEAFQAVVRAYAVAVGLDLAAFNEDMESARVADFVARNHAIAEAVGSSDFSGSDARTHTLFVNGKTLFGTQPRGDFEAAIDHELAAARAAGRAGPAWIKERTRAHAPALYGYVYGGIEPPKVDPAIARTGLRVSGPVVTVNGVAMSAETFYAIVDARVAKANAEYESAKSSGVTSSSNKVSIAGVEWSVHQEFIDDTLRAQAIDEAGIVVPQADIDAGVDAWFGGRDEPREASTVASVAQQVRLDKGIELLLDHKHRLTVTDAEARKAYDARPGAYVEHEGARVYGILIALPVSPSPEADQSALTRSKEVRARLTAGEDFATVAAQVGDARLPKLRGDMGFRRPSNLPRELHDPVAKLALGELSQPIRTELGYFLIKVTERRPFRQLSFEEAKPQISAKLREQKLSEESGKLLTFLRNMATIEVTPPVLAKRRADEAALATREGPDGPAGWDPVADDQIVYRVTVDPKVDPITGAGDALVTLVVFNDFRFPPNGKLKKTLDQVMKAYAGKVRLVFKSAQAATAEAALCAHLQGRFWPFYAKLFDNQLALEDADLTIYAAAVGLDMARWQACVDTHATRPLIEQHVALREQVTTGWATFVNGRKLIGAAPLAMFQRIIDEELAKAAALADDTSLEGEALYRHIIGNGEVFPLGKKVHHFQIDANTPVKGSRDARIQVVVFSDFTNPHSRRLAPVLDEVQSHYGADLSVAYKHFPRPNSRAQEAALAATCAHEQGKFWPIHDRFYKDQWALEHNDDAVRELTRDLDAVRFDACFGSAKYQVVLDVNRAEAKVAGAVHPATIFINGRRFTWHNWPDKEDFISVIDTHVVGSSSPK